jgi:hypothetical protein
MAPLSAARKEQTGLSRSKGRELCNLHRRPCFHNRTPYRGRRPQDCRPLGSRPHALLQTWPSRAHRPRALLASDRWVQAPSQGRGSRGSKACRPVPGNATSHAQDHNGTEFARHRRLHRLPMLTYFCDPHAPWQKGGIENAIGRMRRFLPRKTALATLPPAQFNAVLRAYNNTPRKCLDFRTPAETFAQVLHFECESTFPLARE